MEITIDDLVEKGFGLSQTNLLLKMDTLGIGGLKSIKPTAKDEDIRKFKIFAEEYQTPPRINQALVVAVNEGNGDFFKSIGKDAIDKGAPYIRKLYSLYKDGVDISNEDIMSLSEDKLEQYRNFKLKGYDILDLLKDYRKFKTEVLEVLCENMDLDLIDINEDWDALTASYVCDCKRQGIKYSHLVEKAVAKRKMLLKYALRGFPVDKCLDLPAKAIEYLAEEVDKSEWDKVINIVNNKKLDVKTAYLLSKVNEAGIEFDEVVGNTDAPIARKVLNIAFEDVDAARMMYANPNEVKPAAAVKIYECLKKYGKEKEFIDAIKKAAPISINDCYKLQVIETMIKKNLDYKIVLENSYDSLHIKYLLDAARAGLDSVDIYRPEMESDTVYNLIPLMEKGIKVDATEYINKRRKELGIKVKKEEIER